MQKHQDCNSFTNPTQIKRKINTKFWHVEEKCGFLKAQAHQTNIKEPAVRMAKCCITLHCLCLAKKMHFCVHRRVFTCLLACMFRTCVENNSAYQQVKVV